MEVKPSPKMKTLYWTYYVIGSTLGFLAWALPISVFKPILTPFLFIPYAAITAFFSWWIDKYYDTIKYTIDEDGIIVEKGVFFKYYKYVPADKIHYVELAQGPLLRMYNLATIKIHTAAFSGGGGGGGLPEVTLTCLEYDKASKIKDYIFNVIGAVKAKLSKAKKPKVQEEMLMELRRIRELLEKAISSLSYQR